MPTWRTTAHHGIACDKRRPCQSPRVQLGTVQGASDRGLYIYQYRYLYSKTVTDVGKKLLALVRRSGQLRPYVRPVMRHSPLAIMGVR